MRESILSVGRGAADVVHQAASDQQDQRGCAAVADASEQPQSHQKFISTISVHEN